MTEQPELITVFRSADEDAEEDATSVRDLLLSEGLNSVLLDHTAPGVVEGAYEVRVPPDQVSKAEQLIAQYPIEDQMADVDESHDLDLETIFTADGPMAEMQAVSVKSILEANEISAVIVGAASMPNLPFEVRVAKDLVGKAQQVITDAEAAGPAAAEQGERESEGLST